MTTDQMTQADTEYCHGSACYLGDKKDSTPIYTWDYIKGFGRGIADDWEQGGYESVYAAFVAFFGKTAADTLIDITERNLERDQEWFRWPSIKTK
jgi:hypothetical protein